MLMNRVVLVGDLLPTADKWERIITAGGGQVAITKGMMTAPVKRLIELPSEDAMKLVVVPDTFKENKLVKKLRELGYSPVPSRYVRIPYIFTYIVAS